MNRYPRDLHGYGASPPDPQWPEGAQIAVQFVINYEEGGENSILHGDAASEAFLSEIVGAQAWPGQRHWNMESIYEYGARAGFWRLHRLFTAADIPVTVYAIGTALERSPAQTRAMQDAGWEIASHGHKWIEWKDFERDEERTLIEESIRIHTHATGERPYGWYTGRCTENSMDLIAEIGGFAYTADSYADDLPYWYLSEHEPLLVVPYTLDANDMRFATAQGFNSGDQFFAYLKDSFDALYEEGANGSPKMLSVGLHCRLAGRPGRIQALKRFVEYAQSHDNVWFARRIDIADHWRTTHPAPDSGDRPSTLSREDFVARFGGVFEHSPWVAERAHALELGPAHDTASGVHNAMARAFRAASDAERLEVLRAHPDLAGKLAQARRLTAESATEQASAGLDALTDDERETFTKLNSEYTGKFGFPFIIAVTGLTKEQVLQAFRTRIGHDRDTEFAEACRQVERITRLRLEDMLDD
ncbi:MAG: allantoinase PuuE [Alphaproteobacteria bacterium]|nr:allantoinase PuuE [Alphaproteobacteria bacterium]